MKPQTRSILELLTVAGSDGITPRDAMADAECWRLAARVAELRREGHDIVTVYESNPEGDRWARYVLLPPRPIPDSGVQEALAL